LKIGCTSCAKSTLCGSCARLIPQKTHTDNNATAIIFRNSHPPNFLVRDSCDNKIQFSGVA
jgi:hypothetical protein